MKSYPKTITMNLLFLTIVDLKAQTVLTVEIQISGVHIAAIMESMTLCSEMGVFRGPWSFAKSKRINSNLFSQEMRKIWV